MSGNGNKRGCLGLTLDMILIFATGGLWLVWIVVKYLRNNS